MKHLAEKLKKMTLSSANDLLEDICGIVNFFDSEADKNSFVSRYSEIEYGVSEDRVSYGDWQTPIDLAIMVCKKYAELYESPEIVFEPTCGKGNFILAALETFPDLREIHSIEINKGYTDELKLRILERNIYSKQRPNTRIFIHTQNFFDFDIESLELGFRNSNVAIIGNPPWVTNSRLGVNDSDNLPAKRNFANVKGIDAITGKSNFDISEAITLRLLDLVSESKGGIALLLKNSVIRNIISKQHSMRFPVDTFLQAEIDARKEFGVAVDASCLFVRFGSSRALDCVISDFYTSKFIRRYGWSGNCFVSDIDSYDSVEYLDGKSPFEWRSGVKHDCSSVMELEFADGRMINGLGEIAAIEPDFVYPLLKSSDIRRYSEEKIRKHVIITQHFVGEDTYRIADKAPLTYKYLCEHRSFFDRRKSSIYKGKKSFCIFGIGDYSFKPYKIVVSSLYKDIVFKMVEPVDGKPVIVDDTCYQLGFDSREECAKVFELLESEEVCRLLKSLVFKDSKRVITRDLLMRIALDKINGISKGSDIKPGDNATDYPVQGTLF